MKVQLPTAENRESLTRALRVLGNIVPVEKLQLGGGTALAALWKHRLSTDIDLVCSTEDFPDSDMRSELKRNKASGLERVKITPRFVGWTTPAGRISLSAGRLDGVFDADRLLSSAVAQGVRLVSVEAILYGKLWGRLFDRGRATVRDGYDLAVAMKEDRNAVRGLIEKSGEDMSQLIERIEIAANQKAIGRPLLEPAYPEIAKNPWRETLRGILEISSERSRETETPSPGRLPS